MPGIFQEEFSRGEDKIKKRKRIVDEKNRLKILYRKIKKKKKKNSSIFDKAMSESHLYSRSVIKITSNVILRETDCGKFIPMM